MFIKDIFFDWEHMAERRMDKGGELYVKLSIISLAFLVIILLVIGYFVKQSMKYKTEKEKDASKKGFLAYLLTNSLLIGWLVYKKNNTNDRL